MNKKMTMTKALASGIAEHISVKAFAIQRENWEVKREAFSALVYRKFVKLPSFFEGNEKALSAWISKRNEQTVRILKQQEANNQQQISYRLGQFLLEFGEEVFLPLAWERGVPILIDDTLASESRRLTDEFAQIDQDQGQLRQSIEKRLISFSHFYKAIAAWPELLSDDLLPQRVKDEYLSPVVKVPVVVDFSDLNGAISKNLSLKRLKAA